MVHGGGQWHPQEFFQERARHNGHLVTANRDFKIFNSTASIVLVIVKFLNFPLCFISGFS